MPSKHDEEAKAFAFQFAWAKTIHEENIANLAFNVRPPPPAVNGLHNIAYSFIYHLVEFGDNALSIFRQFSVGMKSVSLEETLGGV